MIVKTLKIGDTTIEVDNTYFPKTKEEEQVRYEEFNIVGCKILHEEKVK